MNALELSKKYMEEYDKLVKDFEERNIADIVTGLNDSVSRSDSKATQELYNQALDWNDKVSRLEGGKIVLNSQYPYLRLPSPSSYAILFDAEDKFWKFNTDRM